MAKIIGALSKPSLNLLGFIQKSTSAVEGTYADTYQNRKLGRVGMTYSQYEKQLKGENSSSSENKEQKEGYSPSNEEISSYENTIKPPSVEERWDAYSLFCNMVSDGTTKSMVAFGTGGVGKTYTLMQVLNSQKLKEFDDEKHNVNNPEEFDYVKITGSASGSSVYKTLFEYNDKLIIFDDCDSVLKDGMAVNFLKGALDSTGDGTISYSTSTLLKTDKLEGASMSATDIPLVPNRFKFKGRVIFISNLPPTEIPQPLIDSRCLSIDLSMSKKETIERIDKILPNIVVNDANGKPLDISPEDKRTALNFLDEHKDSIRDGKLNARTLGNILKIIHASKGNGAWKSAATALLSN